MESKRHSYLEISKLKMKLFWKTFQLYSGNLIFHTSLKAKIHFRKYENAKKMFKNCKVIIFSSGDIPNLFPSDEKAEILEKVSTQARSG